MSHRCLSGLQFCVAALLVLQSTLPILPITGVRLAPAQGMAPVSDALPPVFQPEQNVPPDEPPVGPIPPAEPRLPQGRYVLRLAADGSATRFADLPLTATGQAGAEGGDTTLSLEVLAPDQAAQLSPAGVAFTLAINKTVGAATQRRSSRLQLTLDYDRLNLPTYGGSFQERLTLYRGLGCRPDGGSIACRAFVPLQGVNDTVNRRLTADLDEQALLQRLQPKREPPAEEETPEGKPGKEGVKPEGKAGNDKGADASLSQKTPVAPLAAEGETAASWLVADMQSQQPAVYALAASSSGDQGDFAATPFDSSSDYQLSLAVGAMQTSYAVPLPPAAGGLAPEVTLHYDSGSVDGMTLNKKTSQVGSVSAGITSRERSRDGSRRAA